LSDPSVLALATDAPQQLPQPLPAQVVLLDLNAPEAIVAWMLAQGERLQYVPPKTP
jgi:molybdopterin-guanine dinucleotide biosynthesis protein B